MASFNVITGTGLATAQGGDVATNWSNLYRGNVLNDVGRVALPCDGSPRVSQLAIHVAQQAIAESGWTSSVLSDPRTALVVGTSKGPIDEWLRTETSLADSRASGRDEFGIAQVSTDLSRALSLGFGPRTTTAGACASGLQALIVADQWLRWGAADRAIVVAVESSLHPIFQASFKRLGVLANPDAGCRPFDQSRNGFLMAEAAAAVCIERRNHADGVYLGNSAMRADATHLTGLAADGNSIANALSASEILSADLFHAHGTGTVQNDQVEMAALMNRCAGKLPRVYSNKHAIGHTQGAAGLISVVLSVEMHRRGCVLPNSNSKSPMRSLADRLPCEPEDVPIRRSVVHAAGFGGVIAAICLKSP